MIDQAHVSGLDLYYLYTDPAQYLDRHLFEVCNIVEEANGFRIPLHPLALIASATPQAQRTVHAAKT